MSTTRRPLEGVKCVGILTFQQGPVAFSMMADLGADVIKIEQPGKGEQGRWTLPQPTLNWGPYHETHNRGLKSLTLNFQTDKGREILYKLVKDADIFGENLRPGLGQRYGFAYEDLVKVNPGIVYLSMSAYGPDGPSAKLPGMDVVAQAMGGIAYLFGEGETPLMTGTHALADEVSAYINFQAALVGLYHKKMTGEGQKIETSLLGGQIRLMGQRMTAAMNTKMDQPRVRARFSGGKAPLFAGSFRDMNGKSFVMQTIGEDKWHTAVVAAGFEKEMEAVGCSILADVCKSEELKATLVKTLDRLLATNTRDHWIETFRKADVISAPLNTILEASREPDAIANKYVIEVDHPRLGKIGEVGYPWKFHKTPAKAGIAPELGEHTGEILGGLGYSEGEIGEMKKEGIV